MRKVIILLFIAALGASGVSAYLFFSELSSGFPQLPNGLYVGHLSVKGEEERLIGWVLEKRQGSLDTYVVLADDKFPAQRIPKALTDNTDLPLIIDGPSVRFRLVGREQSGGMYGGDLLNPITQEKGTWTLRRAVLEPLTSEKEKDFHSWAERWNEITVVERKIEAVQAKISEQKAKLEKVSGFVTDGNALKQKANMRLGAATDAVKEVRARVKTLQESLDTSIRDIELSERVSPRGRLVQLSRESIAREARWIGASIQLGTATGGAEYEQELEKALKVKTLKAQIAAEKARLADLDSAHRYGGEDPSTSDEAEFYSNLGN